MGERNRHGTGNGRGARAPLPRALQDGVLTTDLGDEVVVYDSKQHRGHCLNRSAAVVWRHLDGRTSMGELVARLRKELKGPADEDMVWLALKELDRANLLEGPLDLPASRDLSRRRMLRRLGVAAGTGLVLLPAISSIVAPPVHAQASGVGCPTPEPNCNTFSCAGSCACAGTTEGINVCVQPSCAVATPCTASSNCPPGTVCTTIGCCGQAPFCVPIAPAGSNCLAPAPGRATWQ